MARSDRPKRVELEYCFDRLAGKKLAQAYGILVPEVGVGLAAGGGRQGREMDEIRGHIHAGVFGTAERGADHREPGGRAAGVCAG